jgi:hypothetical protein
MVDLPLEVEDGDATQGRPRDLDSLIHPGTSLLSMNMDLTAAFTTEASGNPFRAVTRRSCGMFNK